MTGHECYHCKQWVAEGEAHDCWTTTEAALTRDLSEDLQDAYVRLREAAVELGEQRIYASGCCIMFSRTSCYFFIRPKRQYLELAVFLGRSIDAPDLRRFHGAAEEDTDFEETSLRPHEEVTRFARKHDRAVRRVYPLIAELGGRLTQPFPRITKVLRQVLRQRSLGRGPAIVWGAFLDPLFTVITLASWHDFILWRVIVCLVYRISIKNS